jgi:hypothetical protein
MKAMLKFVVVDDEPLALEILDGYLKRLSMCIPYSCSAMRVMLYII